jgi:hypothetical protein
VQPVIREEPVDWRRPSQKAISDPQQAAVYSVMGSLARRVKWTLRDPTKVMRHSDHAKKRRPADVQHSL